MSTALCTPSEWQLIVQTNVRVSYILLGNASFIYFLNYLLRLYIYYFLKRMLSLVFLRGGVNRMSTHHRGALAFWVGGFDIST